MLQTIPTTIPATRVLEFSETDLTGRNLTFSRAMGVLAIRRMIIGKSDFDLLSYLTAEVYRADRQAAHGTRIDKARL